MITFRYHVVSLVATFLALAGGIALGAGPLQDGVRGQLTTTDSDQSSELADRLDAAERLGEFQSGYGASTAGRVLGGRLGGASVAVIVLPGADAKAVRDVETDLELADAEVVSRLTLTPKLLDPATRQLAEGLAQRVLDGVRGSTAAEGATSYALVGAAFGRAFLSTQDAPLPQDGDAASVQAAFTEAGFLQAATVASRARLALIVAGAPTDSAPEGADDVVAQLIGGFDRAADGAVVVGPTTEGTVAAVRDSETGDEVSTVDAGDTATGRVVAVLALVEQAAGLAGHYGVQAPDGALPDLSQ